MKTKIPDNLKAELPPTTWGKVLGMTPIIMTVIATLLAGIASSEMTHAQYDRSLAAQLQSKAGDQWGYFQAKKMRGTMQQNTLELLQATLEIPPLDQAALATVVASLNSPAAAPTLAALEKAALPAVPPAADFAPNLKAALDALNASKPESELQALLKPVSDEDLSNAMIQAKSSALAFDAVIKPVNADLDHVEKILTQPGTDKGLRQSFLAARLRFGAVRYDNEARLNQVVGNLYELQVRKSNASAEHHHQRSARFFYGMLAAQMGVIISTFAIAARQKNLLWSLAAAAGLAAVSFSAYVFLRV
jgi:hypothetical protein